MYIYNIHSFKFILDSLIQLTYNKHFYTKFSQKAFSTKLFITKINFTHDQKNAKHVYNTNRATRHEK